MRCLVLTLDQRDSRSGPDLVPALLDRLAPIPTLRAFERTAGDEIQGLLDDPEGVTACVALLLRAGAWNIGLGAGRVEDPLPVTTRAGRGTAYLHAREAVTAAKSSPWRLRVAGDDAEAARQLETVLWLWAAVLHRRTDRGWEVADLVESGTSYEEAGRKLGITQSAVSQRAQAAGIIEGRRARELATRMVAGLLANGG